MQASQTTIERIIDGTKQYVVPLFQRAYSWKKEDWDTLWQDIETLRNATPDATHFIGSIVTASTKSVPQGVSKFELIDGQQRLTTIVIMLTAIRDRFAELGETQQHARLNDAYLTNRYEVGTDFYRLLPTQTDRAVFAKIIRGELGDQSVSGSKIAECHRYFVRKIGAFSADALKELCVVVTRRLIVVSILLDSPSDDAHIVFESLNAKGRPLTQADLIRNYFFMRIHQDQQTEQHSLYWEPMEQKLDEKLSEFIRHYLMRDGVFVRKDEVYATLKNKMKTESSLAELQELSSFASFYERLVHPERDPNGEIKLRMKRLNRLDITLSYPFLLNCYRDVTERKITLEMFVEVLHTLESLFIRSFVCNRSSNKLSNAILTLYRQANLIDPENFVHGVRTQLALVGVFPSDEEFAAQLQSAELYGSGQRRINVRLILETIENGFGHKERIDLSNATIEHVMPQKLSQEWRNQLGDNADNIHESYLHTLGNLTLTSYNTELSNLPFSEKRERLRDSHIELNRPFIELKAWGPEQLRARASYLSEIALNLWPSFGAVESAEIAMTADKVTNRVPRGIHILGEFYSAKRTWKEVYLTTLNTLYELDPDAFTKVTEAEPATFRSSKDKMGSPRQLVSGHFVETNRSAKDLYIRCQRFVERMNLSADDWQVELE